MYFPVIVRQKTFYLGFTYSYIRTFKPVSYDIEVFVDNAFLNSLYNAWGAAYYLFGNTLLNYCVSFTNDSISYLKTNNITLNGESASLACYLGFINIVNKVFENKLIIATGSIIEKDKNLYTISKIGRLKKKIEILSNPKFEIPEVLFVVTKKNLTELRKITHLYPKTGFRYLDNKFKLNEI